MSGTFALPSSPHPQQITRPDGEVPLPRPVEVDERPVDSPVHALQQKLMRLEPQGEADDSGESKLPGWLGLALPLIMSISLWFVIIRFIGAFWTK